MAAPRVTKWYAVSDAKIAPITADTAGGSTTYGTIVDVPGIKSVSISGDITTAELRGDNTLLDSNSFLSNVTVTFEYAKLSMDALATMAGGTVVDSGATTAETATWRRLGTDTFGYFGFRAKTPTAGVDEVTGDGHIVLYKCMLSGFPEMGMAEEDYQTFSASAVAVPRLSDSRWVDALLNETAAAITAIA